MANYEGQLSRVEAILRATLGQNVEVPEPLSRVEELLIELKEAIETGGGGGGDITQILARLSQCEQDIDALELADSNLANAMQELITVVNSKANSSDVYTKTEVDTALSGKQGTLTTEQLSAVNSGIDSDKVEQIDTTTTNEVADRAALVEVVDGKDKNRFPFNNLDTIKAQNTGGTWVDNTYTWNGVTFTINEDFSITVNGTATGGNGVLVLSEPGGFSIEEGNWVLSGCPEGGSSTSYSISIATTVSDTGASAQFTSCSAKLVRLYVIEGTTVTNLTFKPMVCSKADWDISQKYIPNKPYITVNSIRVYVSATQPTGARTGDLWIGG